MISTDFNNSFNVRLFGACLHNSVSACNGLHTYSVREVFYLFLSLNTRNLLMK